MYPINYEMLIKILINTLFISMFICVFFFTYAAHIEEKIIKYQMDFLAHDIKSNISTLGDVANNIFKLQIKNYNIGDLSKQDEIIKKNNYKVLYEAVVSNCLYLFFVICIIGFIYYKLDNTINIKKIIIYNLIILCFVAFTEYSFITYFAAHFISIDPNEIKLSLIKNIQKINDNINKENNNNNTVNKIPLNTNQINTNQINTNQINNNNIVNEIPLNTNQINNNQINTNQINDNNIVNEIPLNTNQINDNQINNNHINTNQINDNINKILNYLNNEHSNNQQNNDQQKNDQQNNDQQKNDQQNNDKQNNDQQKNDQQNNVKDYIKKIKDPYKIVNY